ncbi:hypothetical protein G6F53_014230 [Rhizopus delemar]|nr:hypothetical protein G6F53_014230 [Rhizopus delemar]
MGDRSQGTQQGPPDRGRPALQPLGRGGRRVCADPYRHRHRVPGRPDQLPVDRGPHPARVRAELHRHVVPGEGRIRLQGWPVFGLQRREAQLRPFQLGLRLW